MRGITLAAVLLTVSATAFAAPKTAPKKAAKAHKMTAQACSVACTKAMHAKGMAGSCPVAMCKSGACPMMSKSSHPSAHGAHPSMKGKASKKA